MTVFDLLDQVEKYQDIRSEVQGGIGIVGRAGLVEHKWEEEKSREMEEEQEEQGGIDVVRREEYGNRTEIGRVGWMEQTK